MKQHWPQLICLVLAAVMLGVMAWDIEAMYVDPGDAEPYHVRVRAEASRVPRELGAGWIARDLEMIPEAVKMLKPNVRFLRQYRHEASGKAFNLLFSQSSHAHDMGGHFPPVCYPNAGWWVEDKSQRRDLEWTVLGKQYQGREYIFKRVTADGEEWCAIQNLILLPDGQMAMNMGPVRRAAGNYQKRAFGAAQFQIIYDASTSPDVRDRDTAFYVIGLNRDLIALLLDGVPDEHK